ncbi:hypothetical protein CBS9595_000662 [Malassezia furfur]|nr:hypothetical protein CBS9595_000662 [Malassezia furfur]
MFISDRDEGSGRSLPIRLLLLCTCATLFTTVYSSYSIWLQLKHYYKPFLQRYVVRILVMPLLYAITSAISLYSLQLAEMIGLVRDLYEAFVIYCFFNLLVEYLSGESEILTMLRGRNPTPHIFPLSLFLAPADLSDPYVFLWVKRGVQQYVQFKPILAIATVILKFIGKYEDGRLGLENGYTWISLLYNVSVFIALYSLTLFWMCLRSELKPFHVAGKFMCVKGVIFFSFWQGLTISILVAAGIIRHIGSVQDDIYLSAALQDALICLEMPFFAVGHAYAFSYFDFIQPPYKLAGRMPFLYALRDSFEIGDIISDTISTFRGTDYTYEAVEPNDTTVYQSRALSRRSRAGLRYVDQGKGKYWVQRSSKPRSTHDVNHNMQTQDANERTQLNQQSRFPSYMENPHNDNQPDDISILQFDDPTKDEDRLYELARKLPFGDYRYPCVSPSIRTGNSMP